MLMRILSMLTMLALLAGCGLVSSPAGGTSQHARVMMAMDPTPTPTYSVTPTPFPSESPTPGATPTATFVAPSSITVTEIPATLKDGKVTFSSNGGSNVSILIGPTIQPDGTYTEGSNVMAATYTIKVYDSKGTVVKTKSNLVVNGNVTLDYTKAGDWD